MNLDRIRELGYDWDTLLVGISGVGLPAPVLSADEAQRLGLELDAPTPTPEAYLDFAGAAGADHDAVVAGLEALASRDPKSMALGARRWRLLLLEEVLYQLTGDAIHDLTLLTDFWNDFDFPADSPHQVQGRGNDIEPGRYYTRDYRDRMVERHRVWLERERLELLWPG